MSDVADCDPPCSACEAKQTAGDDGLLAEMRRKVHGCIRCCCERMDCELRVLEPRSGLCLAAEEVDEVAEALGMEMPPALRRLLDKAEAKGGGS